jgi:hypothetical protein
MGRRFPAFTGNFPIFVQGVTFFTNFCPAGLFLCEYYKKVPKQRFFRLILRSVWHTIGDERIMETLSEASLF